MDGYIDHIDQKLYFFQTDEWVVSPQVTLEETGTLEFGANSLISHITYPVKATDLLTEEIITWGQVDITTTFKW